MKLLRRSPARRAVPWLLVLDLARDGHAHWKDRLTPAERTRLVTLLKTSKGRPAALDARERDELKALTAKLDVKAFGKRAAITTAGVRATRGRKKRR